MNSQHLSDEAVAAFADGVLTGHARGRATKHTAECAECATAVQVQREAAWALRAAPAPALPIGLMDRLRGLPDTTPISTLPTVIGPDGSTMLSTLAPMAAFAPTAPGRSSTHRARPFITTAAVVALAGALATGSVAAGRGDSPTRAGTGHQVRDPGPSGGRPPGRIAPDVSLFRNGGN